MEGNGGEFRRETVGKKGARKATRDKAGLEG